MNTVTVTETKNQVTVNETTNTVTVQEGVATVVTVKTEGPQGQTLSDGDKGDITVANNGTSVTVNSGVIDNANIASNAAIQGSKILPSFGSQNVTTTGNFSCGGGVFTFSNDAGGKIRFLDTNNNPDFFIRSSQGSFQIDQISDDPIIKVNSDKHVDINYNLDLAAELNITNVNPKISLTDTNNDSDFALILNQGIFRIRDLTNSSTDRFTIDSSGTVNVAGNLDIGAGLDVTGDISVSGTVDSRDLAADGTKLDGIETGATADQTASEILTLIKTVDGSGSGLNADLLDGINGANFLRSDTSDTMNGDLTLSGFSPDLNFVSTTNNPDWKITNYEGTLILFDITNNANKFLFRTDEFQSNVLIDAKAGIDVTGNLTVSGDLTVSGTTTTIDTTTLTVEDKNIELGKVSTPTDTTADGGGLTLKGATDKTFQWLDATDSWTSSEHIALPDNKMLQLGSSQDLQIYHDGTHSYINESGTGRLFINTSKFTLRNSTSTENVINGTPNGAVELYYDNSKKFETTSTGVSVTGNLQIPADNAKLQLGASQDLQIFHDGDNTFIENNSGNLFIRGVDNKNIYIQARSGENSIFCQDDGTVELYFNNSKKIETTSTGIKVNPVVTIDGSTPRIQMKVTGNEQSHRIEFYNTADSMVSRIYGDPSTGDLEIQTGASGIEKAIKVNSNGAVDLYFDGGTYSTPKLSTLASGVVVNGELDINSASYARTMYQASGTDMWSVGLRDSAGGDTDYHIFRELGHSGEVQIGAKINAGGGLDVTGAITSTVSAANADFLTLTANMGNNNGRFLKFSAPDNDSGSQPFTIVSNNALEIEVDNARVFFAEDNGAAYLYFDGTEKVVTSASGITVTGSEHKFVNNSTGDLKLILEADTSNTAGNENNNPYILFRQDGGGFGDFSVIGSNPHGINTENNALVLANSTNAQGGIIFKTGDTNGHANATEKFRVNTTGILATGAEHKFTSGTSGDCTVIIEADTGNSNEDNNPKLLFRQDGGLDLGSIGMNFSNSSSGGTNNQLYIAASTGDAAISFLTGTTAGYTNASERLKITHDGNVEIPVDSKKLLLGASQDLQLVHNGTDSFVSHTTGSGVLRLNTSTGGEIHITKGGPEYMGKFIPDGAVELYFDNVKKLDTKSWGVFVHGSLVSTGLIKVGSYTDKFLVGENNEFSIQHDDTNTILENTAGNIQFITTSTGQLRVRGHAYIFNSHNDQEGVIKAYENAQVELYYDGVKKLETTSAGIAIDELRLGGMKFPKVQPNNGIDFMHLGHGGASGFGELDCFTGMMRIKANEVQLANRFGNVEMLTCNAFGSVEAYHNGTKRIETTSTGVDVNGKVSENGVTITSKATALSLVFS